MRHFMEAYLLSKESISFNFNPLETNVINLALLFILLFYAVFPIFKNTLENRKSEIIQLISIAQDDLSKSLHYYKLSAFKLNKGLNYLSLCNSLYYNEKKEQVSLIHQSAQQKIIRNFLNTESLLRNLEAATFLSAQRYVLLKVASKILRKFFSLPRKEQTKLLEQIILSLGGYSYE